MILKKNRPNAILSGGRNPACLGKAMKLLFCFVLSATKVCQPVSSTREA
jgi:hypothetical protein